MSAIKPSENSFIQSHSVDVPAGKTRDVNTVGRVFVCTEAAGSFLMSYNDGEYFNCKKGVEWALVGEDRFNRLRFKNTSSTTLTIDFYAGNFFFHENVVVPVFKAAQTAAFPGVNTIAATTNVDLTTVPAGMTYRKSLIVTNLDAAVDLDIYAKDAAAAWQLAATVFAKQAWYVETSADLRIRNPSAGAVNCRILETFYLA